MSYTAQAILENNHTEATAFIDNDALISDSLVFADPLLLLEVEELEVEETQLFA